VDRALEYVSKYVAEPRIVRKFTEDDALMSDLPEWWRGVLLASGEERIRKTLGAWEGHRSQLPTVFEFLSAHLQSVNVLVDKACVRLLYELEENGRTMFYAGGNPRRKSMTASVQSAWRKLPVDFTRFYDSLHNGWYYLATNSLGPSPSEDFFILDDLEWGILDEIGDPGCDMKDLLAVYTNGMGGYVALSVEHVRTYGDVLWWKDKAPHLRIDAWAVMDAWTRIGLSG
jgi:hypothetical protein